MNWIGEGKMFTNLQKKLAFDLIKIDAIKFGEFKLKLHKKKPDAPLSPIYIDLRILRSFPKIMATTINVYKDILKDIKFDLLSDIPTASTPIVAILSHILGIGMISPRKEVKEHGMKAKVEGFYEKGQNVLLIDDLITQADSKFEAINALEQNGLIVKNVVVLLDREQGGASQLENRGYSFHCAYRLSELLEYYGKNEYITKIDYDRTLNYIRSTI